MLTVRTGARAGHRERLTADFATIGRHPSSELQLDPDRDRDVSARHAAVFRQGPTFVVRDLGSTNGTWVNGVRIRSDRPLEPGDRIRLGPNGPELEFAIIAALEAPAPKPSSPAVVEDEAVGKLDPGEGTTTDLKIRIEVARQTDRLRRRLLLGLGLIVAVGAAVAGTALYRTSRARMEAQAERTRLLAQMDSLGRELQTAARQAGTLRQALDSAREEAGALRSAIAGGARESLPGLDSLVSAAISRHEVLVRAAGFDAGSIARRHAPAVVMVFAQFDDGRSVGATGFVARARGDTGWIVTARHTVTDRDGRPAARIAAAVSGRRDVYRTDLVRRHDSLDLAVLRIVSRLGVPVLDAPARPVAVGSPVASIGYPFGLDLPMGGEVGDVGLTPTTFTATVTRVLPDLVQLDGYGAVGASGSPVFGAGGGLAGMVYGGQPESGGRIVYAVPAAAIEGLLGRLGQDRP